MDQHLTKEEFEECFEGITRPSEFEEDGWLSEFGLDLPSLRKEAFQDREANLWRPSKDGGFRKYILHRMYIEYMVAGGEEVESRKAAPHTDAIRRKLGPWGNAPHVPEIVKALMQRFGTWGEGEPSMIDPRISVGSIVTHAQDKELGREDKYRVLSMSKFAVEAHIAEIVSGNVFNVCLHDLTFISHDRRR